MEKLPIISHALFTNDTIISINRKQKYITSLITFISKYEKALGQLINRRKSPIYSHLITKKKKSNKVEESTTMKLDSLCFTYFGHLIFKGKTRMKYFESILTKI